MIPVVSKRISLMNAASWISAKIGKRYRAAAFRAGRRGAGGEAL
jgi:hypothetical protein